MEILTSIFQYFWVSTLEDADSGAPLTIPSHTHMITFLISKFNLFVLIFSEPFKTILEIC